MTDQQDARDEVEHWAPDALDKMHRKGDFARSSVALEEQEAQGE